MIKAIVWDIGGVLVNDPDIRNFWKNKKGAKELRKKFGSGEISIKDFINKGSKLLKISKGEFTKRYKEAYCSKGIIKEVFGIYKKVKKDNYLLSDTNPIHARFLKSKFPGLFNIPKKVFLSHKTKLRKDNPKTFKFLIDKLRLPPEQILFIDNNPAILKVSKKFGITSLLCDNPKRLKNKIKKVL